MTNEECIKMLKSKLDGNTDTSYEWCECVRLAVKALEQQPEDCISRTEALKAIEKEKQGWEGTERYAIDECHSRIAELPSATPQRPKGKWIDIGIAMEGRKYKNHECDMADAYYCDYCGYNQYIKTNYCPWCGAEMVGEKEE